MICHTSKSNIVQISLRILKHIDPTNRNSLGLDVFFILQKQLSTRENYRAFMGIVYRLQKQSIIMHPEYSQNGWYGFRKFV